MHYCTLVLGNLRLCSYFNTVTGGGWKQQSKGTLRGKSPSMLAPSKARQSAVSSIKNSEVIRFVGLTEFIPDTIIICIVLELDKVLAMVTNPRSMCSKLNIAALLGNIKCTVFTDKGLLGAQTVSTATHQNNICTNIKLWETPANSIIARYWPACMRLIWLKFQDLPGAMD